jgi:hypothetical protein
VLPLPHVSTGVPVRRPGGERSNTRSVQQAHRRTQMSSSKESGDVVDKGAAEAAVGDPRLLDASPARADVNS